MASQNEFDRVEAEIGRKNQSWWQQMLDNVDSFFNWLSEIVSMFKLSTDILSQVGSFLGIIGRLLR